MSDAALSVLAVDDEVPQLEDLARLLRANRRVSDVETAASAHDAVMKARERGYDAVFLDVRMPELDGLELAKVLNAFPRSPPGIPRRTPPLATGPGRRSASRDPRCPGSSPRTGIRRRPRRPRRKSRSGRVALPPGADIPLPARDELAEDTAYGELYLTQLRRAQLELSRVIPRAVDLHGPSAQNIDISIMVGWAVALAASTFCPLFLLGIWWSRLTGQGAAAGIIVGGVVAIGAILAGALIDAQCAGGAVNALLTQPAIISVPVAFVAMIAVSLVTARPKDVRSQMLALHAPEGLASRHSSACARDPGSRRTIGRSPVSVGDRRRGRRSAVDGDRGTRRGDEPPPGAEAVAALTLGRPRP